MDLIFTATFSRFPTADFLPIPSKLALSCRRKLLLQNRRFSTLQIRSNSALAYVHSQEKHLERESGSDALGDSESIDVIGIGSRKDDVLDFCLDSSFASSSLKFWTIHMSDSQKVQLLQRSLGKDMVLRNLDIPIKLLSLAPAVILVVSAGYGSHHNAATELLRAVKLAEGLSVAIVMKPFSFEGQRRQHEVEGLVNNLRECTNFCIVVDTDALLKEEVVTLAEALRSANSAVLLAINAIYVLVSDKHPKLFYSSLNEQKEVKVPEVLKLLESYKEAVVGFGGGSNIEASIARAVFDCPFLNSGLKDLKGMIVCSLASADAMDRSDMNSFVQIFRQTTECPANIIVATIQEPNLEQNSIVTTILVMGNRQEIVHKKSFLSSLALRFPFVFSFLARYQPDSKDHLFVHSERITQRPKSGDFSDLNPVAYTNGNLDLYSEELEIQLSNNYDDVNTWRRFNDEDKKTDYRSSEAYPESASSDYSQDDEGESAFLREPLITGNFGPGFHIAQQWAQQRTTFSGAGAKMEKLHVYSLPVGVKPSEQYAYVSQLSNTRQQAETKIVDEISGESLDSSSVPSWDALTDAGLEAVADAYNAASAFIKGRSVDVSRKQGLLSTRAASMLDAERDSQKKWSPVVEIQYRGGTYKGRCQGGLPEGKGCLTLKDGSFYDGMWRYGKRSGTGTYYFSDGDVFQGSWRDDLIHGKGWFYFHTGDRWFANFWKGKANGEGRFYSRFGNIFFGHFQDGWRHGQSLCIDDDGTRWVEIWDEGALVSRNKLDSDSGT